MKELRMVLWDVDGTLLTTGGASQQALSDAGRSIFGEGFTLDGVSLAGRLDPAIWRDVARANGLGNAGAVEERFWTTYLDCLRRQQASRPTICLLPGVRELVGALAGVDHVTQGILSGNYPEVGRFKVESAGLGFGRFPVRVWGSDGETRRDLVPVALARYIELVALPIDAGQVVVIGDTPRDIDCARAHGCRCLAVATGRFQEEALERAGADCVRADLADTEEMLRWLCRGSTGQLHACTSMIEYTLRRAGDADTAGILELVGRAGLTIGTVGFDPTRFVVAESRDGQIIGCARLKPHVGGYVELASVAVDEPCRGQGVGRAVIEHLLEPVSRPVFLACRAALGPFYERFGFRAVGWSRMPLPIGCVYGLVLGALRLARVAAVLVGGETRQRLERIAEQAGGQMLVMRLDR